MSKAKDLALSVVKNLPAPIAGLAVQLSAFNPEWAGIIALGTGLLTVYADLAVSNGSELLEYIEAHHEEFVEEVINSSEFKAAFVNVWEMHIRESDENKRKRLRYYLLNLGKGKDIPNDTHTKIYNIIQQMTEREAVAFGIIIGNSNRDQARQMHLNTEGMTGFTGWSSAEQKDAIHSLYTYRLIDMTDATIGGGMSVQQITPFGELFYDYVITEPTVEENDEEEDTD